MALALTVLVGLPSIAVAQAPLEWAEGRILVQPRAGLSEVEFNRILQRSNGKSKAKIGNLNVHIVEVPPQAEQAVARALSRNPHVKFAEVDGLIEASFIPNDPQYGSQWYLEKMQAPTAWDATQGEGITVAVMDTGVDPNHPDFQGQLVTGRNVVSDNSDTSDIAGHGTAVAGVIGALTNNSNQIAGLAGQVKMMPVRVTNRSDTYTNWSDLARGLTWAADHGATVACATYLANGSSTVTTAANYFRSKGGIVVNSAGNNGTNPGYGDTSAMITVSATDSNDVKASWSNYGNMLDVAAPGVSILTTGNGGITQTWSGTSFSAPLTAAVVALIMAKNPNLSISEVEAVLEDSADDLGSALYYGAGRVNAAQAVQLAGNSAGGGDTQRPTVSIFNPVRDGTVNGWVPVDVNATDNVGVNKVVLYAGSVKVGEDTVPPYQFSWNSANENDGPVTLIAYAYDAANNEGSSGSHPVTVDNVPDTPVEVVPTVTIVSPAEGSKVKGIVAVDVLAASDKSLLGVVLYVGSTRLEQDIEAPFQFSWDSTSVSDGNVTLVAHAYDTEFKKGSSEARTIRVDNTPGNKLTGFLAEDATAPTVSIENPLNGSTVYGKIPIVVYASDESELSITQIYVDDQFKFASDRSYLMYEWQTHKSGKGSHTIKVRATDAANNVTETQIHVSVENQKLGKK